MKRCYPQQQQHQQQQTISMKADNIEKTKNKTIGKRK